MAKVVRLSDYRRSNRRVTFNRQELRQLLDVYTRRVMSGEWRDYAIDHQAGMAVFSIFRHTADGPLFRVAKVAGPGERPDEYLVVSGPRRLKSGSTIDEVLSIFDRRKLELVT